MKATSPSNSDLSTELHHDCAIAAQVPRPVRHHPAPSLEQVAAGIGALDSTDRVCKRGLGYLVFSATTNLDTVLVFTAVTLLAVMGIVLFQLVRLAQKLALPWALEAEEGEA